MGCGSSKNPPAVLEQTVELNGGNSAVELNDGKDPIVADEKIEDNQVTSKKSMHLTCSLELKKVFVPSSGFVVKTRRCATGTKVFINISSSEDFPWDSCSKVIGVTWPSRATVDKRGSPSLVYDHLMRPASYRGCLEDSTGEYRSKAIESCFQQIFVCFNDRLEKNYTLPMLKRGMMGEVVELEMESLPSQKKIILRHEQSRFDLVNEPGDPPSDYGVNENFYEVACEEAPAEKNETVEDEDDSQPYSAISPTSSPVMMTGYLMKQGHIVQNWKTRYFVLDAGFLRYFVKDSPSPPFGRDCKGGMSLRDYLLLDLESEISKLSESFLASLSEGLGHILQGNVGVSKAVVSKRFILVPKERIPANSAEGSSADRIIMLLEAADRTEKLMWMSSIRAHILFADHSSKSTQESENTPANIVNAAEGAAQESGSDAASSKAKSINSDWTKYQIFLSMNEEIVMLRVLNKPNPIGIPYRRLVILTSFHRLLYIEPNTLDVKGEISLSSVNAVNKVDENTFTLLCNNSRVYKFIDEQGCDPWVQSITSVLQAQK